jgi:hypothetical protein
MRGNGPTAIRSCRIFIDKQDQRYPAALGALPNEMDGIIIKQLVSASMIKQHAHDVLDPRARRARQGKLA